MSAATLPKLQLPSVGRLKRYLRATGWKEISVVARDLNLYSKSFEDTGLIEIVLAGNGSQDSKERLYQAIRIIAAIDQSSIDETASKIRLYFADSIDAIVPDSSVFLDSISLSLAGQIVSLMREVTLKAASNELRQRGSESSDDYNSFIDSCKFGHTFRGSFGFRLEAQIGGSEKPADAPVPFERLVTQRIARGLRSIEAASINRSAAFIVDHNQIGFGLAELLAVETFLQDAKMDPLLIKFGFSADWKVDADLTQQVNVNISHNALFYVQEAVAQLRPKEREYPHFFVEGRVVSLSSKNIPADLFHPEGREITILTQGLLGKEGRVHVRVSADQYIEAVTAHLNGTLVSVRGVVRQTGNQLRIDEPWSVSFIIPQGPLLLR